MYTRVSLKKDSVWNPFENVWRGPEGHGEIDRRVTTSHNEFAGRGPQTGRTPATAGDTDDSGPGGADGSGADYRTDLRSRLYGLFARVSPGAIGGILPIITVGLKFGSTFGNLALLIARLVDDFAGWHSADMPYAAPACPLSCPANRHFRAV